MFKLSRIISCLFFTVSLIGQPQQELPEPYNQVEILPFHSHGFYSNAQPLETLIRIYNVKTIIEVGCWLGTSTRHMASLLPASGKVYAVDHWKGSEEHQPGHTYWLPILPLLYEQFLSNVIHAGLTDKIVPVRMDSLQAAKELSSIVPDLIYIDAGHDYESVYADLNAWYPLVQGHGILCGDDWGMPGVQSAVKQFAGERGLRIDASGFFWRLIERQAVPIHSRAPKKIAH